MTDSFIIQSLKNLRKIDCELDNCSHTTTTLLYPQKNEPKKNEPIKRISEQEAKILFCQLLLENKVYFSIETPTLKKYSFTGKSNISGNLDLCIYELIDNKYIRSNCIEYKAHNVSKDFKGDMEKLLFEKGDNYFVHVLPKVDNGTLYTNKSNRNAVINKYVNTIKSLKDSVNIGFSSLTFYICILSPFCILSKKIVYSELNELDNIMSLNYIVKKGQLIINNSNWIRIDD